MTILLKGIWPIEKLDDYKVHFARWNGSAQPLEVFVRDKAEWQGCRNIGLHGMTSIVRSSSHLFSFIMRQTPGCLAAFSAL